MKSSIYLISALILISCASGHGSSHHQDRLDDLTTEILDYGINFIFERAADKYGVSTDNVEVTKINNIKLRDLSGPRTLYRFNVAATNNNDATLKARFDVKYNHETGEMTMGKKWRYNIHYYPDTSSDENEFEGFPSEEEDNSWENAIDEGEIEIEVETDAELELELELELEIEVETETGVDEEGTDDNNEDFVEVPEEEIENALVISEVLQVGAAFIFDRATDRFGVSNNDIQITNVGSVFRRSTEDNKTIYRIHIDATNNDDATVEARLTIEHDNETGENVAGPWRYSIRYQAFNDEEGGNFEDDAILEFDINDGLADIL